MAIFGKNPRGWALEASNLQYGEYGSWGYPPTIHLQPIGPDRFGLMMQTDRNGQGVYEIFETIIVPVAGGFTEALTKQISQSWDEDGCSGNVSQTRASTCIAYDGGFDLKPAPGSEFYDLLFIRRIYRSLSQKTPEGATVGRYRFDGSRYMVVPAAQ